MYYIYMIRCNDNSVYTGITTNIDRRIKEHFSKDKKCAKYTYTHTVKKLECVWSATNRILASKLEYYIKRLSKFQKESLILNPDLLGELIEKIDSDEYIYIKIR